MASPPPTARELRAEIVLALEATVTELDELAQRVSADEPVAIQRAIELLRIVQQHAPGLGGEYVCALRLPSSKPASATLDDEQAIDGVTPESVVVLSVEREQPRPQSVRAGQWERDE